jgi:hypothetical protein
VSASGADSGGMATLSCRSGWTYRVTAPAMPGNSQLIWLLRLRDAHRFGRLPRSCCIP